MSEFDSLKDIQTGSTVQLEEVNIHSAALEDVNLHSVSLEPASPSAPSYLLQNGDSEDDAPILAKEEGGGAAPSDSALWESKRRTERRERRRKRRRKQDKNKKWSPKKKAIVTAFVLLGLFCFAILVYGIQHFYTSMTGNNRVPNRAPPTRVLTNCDRGIDKGAGISSLLRYGYDGSTCVAFRWKGQQGNVNRFFYLRDCQRECEQKTSAWAPYETGLVRNSPFCATGIEAGSCSDKERRFGFDGSACVEFEYSGCGESENNFFTKNECVDLCPGYLCQSNDQCAKSQYCEFGDEQGSFKSCRPYQTEGGRCGGFNHVSNTKRCGLELTCNQTGSGDKPGHCTKV